MSDVTIKHCGRTVAGNFVAFDIQWEGRLPDARSLAWAMVITAPDGKETVRLTLQQVAGRAAQHVEATSGRVELDADAEVDDGEVTVRFPANVVGVAVEWPVWTAVMEADGHELSTCVVPIS